MKPNELKTEDPNCNVIRMTSDEFDRAMTIQFIMRTKVWVGSADIPVTEEQITALTKESMTVQKL